MMRRKYRNMHQYLRALENRAEKGCLRRFVRWFRDVRMIGKCRKILWSELDRDRDESDSLRALVVVAVNALHRERTKGFLDPWFHVNDLKPEEGEWVLHAYAGVRAPEYGHFRGGRFFAPSKGGTLPATHWLRIPDIEANDQARPQTERQKP